MNSIGTLSWEYNGKTHSVSLVEIEHDFDDEWFLRYRTHDGRMTPIIRVVKSNRRYNGFYIPVNVHFLTERSFNGVIDWPEFETKGCKGELFLD